MTEFSIAELIDAGAAVALVAAFLWITTRCDVRIDCHGEDDHEPTD